MARKIVTLLLIAVVTTLTATAQNRKVVGTVTSEDGEPVVGASVMVVGTKVGTVTDVDGKFSFNDIPMKATQLRVTYLGMQPKVAAIKPNLKIVLAEESRQLSDVIVVAYGTAKKSS